MKLLSIKFYCASFFLFIIYTTNAQVVKVYEQNIDSNTITTILESPKVNFPILESQDQYYLDAWKTLFSGTKIPKERIIGVTHKNIITYDNIQHQIKKYDFKFNLIQSFNEYDFPRFMLGNSGNFIVTDEYEASGTVIKIYSKNLELINTIQPFGESFFRVIFNSSQDSLTSLLVVPQGKGKYLKTFLIKNKNGEIILENELLLEEMNISSTLLAKDYLVIRSFKKLSLVDFRGRVIWEKNFSNHSPHPFYFDANAEIIYGYSYENILYGFSLKKGNEVLKKDIRNQLSNSPERIYVYSLDFLPGIKKAIMHLRKSQYVKDSRILIFNKEGRLEHDLLLDENMEQAHMIVNPERDQILLINEQKIWVYEIN